MVTVGVVPYLNAVPLAAGFGEDVTLVTDVPSRLGPRLEAGEIDVALLPVAEALGGVGDGFAGCYGITSEGPVASVLLFLRRPPAALRRVVLDGASRSSAGLARWLVRDLAGEGVVFEVADRPGPDPKETPGDAVMLIGDPAMAHAHAWDGEVLDLGAAWTARTGLPFVYARWTFREGLSPKARADLARLLDEAGARGVRDRIAHARAWAAAAVGRDPEEAVRYVLRHVGYVIGPREEEGLRRYGEILRDERLARVGDTHRA